MSVCVCLEGGGGGGRHLLQEGLYQKGMNVL